VQGRKCYANPAGKQTHPLTGTIFEKSSTSLTNWFYAIYLFSQSRNGVSAKELERQLGVTYKTAWRIAKHIRALMNENGDPLTGTVEVDETFIGGKDSSENRHKGKSAVMGMVERQGRIKAVHIPNRQTHILGYRHSSVKHGKKHYGRKGDIYTNTIEGFWSQLKRSMDGTYHVVSPKYLQSYVNEFSYRYNHRTSEMPMFHHLLAEIVV